MFSFCFLRRLIGRYANRPTCPRCCLIEQARELVDRGYYVGAVATARCELEAKLKAAVYALGCDRPDSWHSHSVAIHLHRQGLLSLAQARRVSAAMAISSAMIRSVGKCHSVKAHRMLQEIEAVIAMLERAPRFAKAVAIAA